MKSETPGPTVYLYLAIPLGDAFAPIRRSTFQLMKNRIRREVDLLLWRVTGCLKGNFSTFEDVKKSNVGDIAVGMAVEKLFFSKLRSVGGQIKVVPWGGLSGDLIQEINSSGGVFVVGGSGYFHCGGDGVASRLCQQDIALLEQLTVQIHCLGVGLNLFVSAEWSDPAALLAPETIDLLRRYGRIFQVFTVRDHMTAGVFCKAGAKTPAVIGDPVYSLPRVGGKFGDLTGDGDGIRVGVNFALHGPTAFHIFSDHLETYLDFLRLIQETYNCKLVYFAHSSGDNIVRRIFRSAALQIEYVAGGPCDLLSEYERLDVHVCQMMHSSILAMCAGVPVLNLAYDMKSKALFEMMGLEEFCLEPSQFELDIMERKFRELLSARAVIRCNLASRIDDLKVAQSEAVDEIISSLQE